MKKNTILSYFYISILVLFFSLGILNAQAANDGVVNQFCEEESGINCLPALQCINNVCIDPNSKLGGSTALQEGDTCGESASSQCDSSKNLVCQNFTCVKGSTGTGNGGGGGGSTQMTCPTGLTNQNGLCLPATSAFPTTGLAGSTTLVDLITKVIQLLLTFAGIISVVFLVLGGYWYMASGGNEELAEKGKKTIVNFVMGLVVIIMAYALVTILFNTLTSNKYTQ